MEKKFKKIWCCDRKRWYPATICDVKEEILENGYKKIIYRIVFRIYPKYFKNINDKNDIFENYLCFWENREIELDQNNLEYYGDSPYYDEDIVFYSKRIQKFQSYTNIQKEYLNQDYNLVQNKEMNKINLELENDYNDYLDDGIFIYEKNGKKKYVIGKKRDFSYYYSLFLKKLGNDNIFDHFVKMIDKVSNSEEILNLKILLFIILII